MTRAFSGLEPSVVYILPGLILSSFTKLFCAVSLSICNKQRQCPPLIHNPDNARDPRGKLRGVRRWQRNTLQHFRPARSQLSSNVHACNLQASRICEDKIDNLASRKGWMSTARAFPVCHMALPAQSRKWCQGEETDQSAMM